MKDKEITTSLLSKQKSNTYRKKFKEIFTIFSSSRFLQAVLKYMETVSGIFYFMIEMLNCSSTLMCVDGGSFSRTKIQVHLFHCDCSSQTDSSK